MAQLRKLRYLAAALLPFGLFALLSWRTLPLVAYGAAVPLLASSWPLYTFGFQYGLSLVCPALVGATFVLAGRDTGSAPKYRRAWIALGLAGTALVVLQLRPRLAGLDFPRRFPHPRCRHPKRVADAI